MQRHVVIRGQGTVAMGRGWGCDRQYQPYSPPDHLPRQLESMAPVEVPPVLDAKHYLDIIGEKSWDE